MANAPMMATSNDPYAPENLKRRLQSGGSSVLPVPVDYKPVGGDASTVQPGYVPPTGDGGTTTGPSKTQPSQPAATAQSQYMTAQSVTAPSVNAPDALSPGTSETPANPNMPDASNLYGKLSDYASNWLDNPNPYLSDAANAQRAAGQAAIDQQRTDSTRAINEWAASRGLTGSSYEGDQMAQLESYMNQQKLAQESDIMNQLASGEQAGRTAASGMATNVAQGITSQALAQRSLDLQQQGMTADQAYRQATLEQNAQIANMQASLQAQGMNADDAYRYAALSQNADYQNRVLELQQQGLDAQTSYQKAYLELQGQQLTQTGNYQDTLAMLQALQTLAASGDLSPEMAKLLNDLYPDMNATATA